MTTTRAWHNARRAEALCAQGRFAEALELFRESTLLQPAEAEFHYGLGFAAWMLQRPEIFEPHFLQAIRLNPRHRESHKLLAQWYTQQGQIARALQHSEMALQLAPDDIECRVTRAAVLTADGQAQAAWDLLAPLVAAAPGNRHVANTYAQLARVIGHQPQALAVVQRALQDPRLPPSSRTQLHYSAASLLDAMGRYDEAFAQATLANNGVARRFDPAECSAWFTRQINYFTRERLAALPRATHGNRRPVFIVGMPRSGTSLIEQILASHPAVFGGGELPLLHQIGLSIATTDWARGLEHPQCLNALSILEANRLAGEYLAGIDALNTTATFVTDKMPRNFERLGLAELLLPGCHVIHCTRDPRDTCLSCYMTGFATSNAFSLNLEHLASYYRDYQRLMEHWCIALRLPVLEVRYEEVIADQTGQTRRMLEFLELPWDDQCLDFHTNKRPITTASRDQVRKPLYGSSIGRWKKYEKHIPQLLELAS